MIKEGTKFSWRKILTAEMAILFFVAVLGYLIKHGFEELPMTYSGIITITVLSYFGKEAINKIGNNNGVKK